MAINSEICYKANFLRSVVIQVSFTQPITQKIIGIPSELRKAVIKEFPIEKERPGFTTNVQINAETQEVTSTSSHVVALEFTNISKAKTLVIDHQSIAIEYNRYRAYEELMSDFSSLVQAIIMQNPEMLVGRLGLRYINQIMFPQFNHIDWKLYLNRRLLGLHSKAFSIGFPLRIMHSYIYGFDDMMVNFQFGEPNPEFPARQRTNLFVLDYDASFLGLFSPNDLTQPFDKLHSTIQKLFESHITAKLRDVMNGK